MPTKRKKQKKKSGWKSRPIGQKKIKRTKKRKKRPVRKLLFTLIFLILLVGAMITGIFAWLSRDLPHPEKFSQRNIAQSTKIYDRTGKVILYEIFAEQRRTLINLSDIPQHLIYATLVSEDKDFFQHPGFDLKAIVRAILVDILRGGKVQGGSTLTQQFVKNAFLTPQKTYQRKIKEVLLAYQIEKKYSKEEILQMYFNEIPYGSNAYGAEAASQIYFNKSVRDLTLDEAVLLSALPKAPTYYSPYGDHLQELIIRKDYILNSMANEGYITREIAIKTKEINVLEKITPRRENITAPHFIMYVKNLLTEKYSQRVVEQGGLKVITTLDVNKQKIAEQAIEARAEKNEEIFKATNAALVSLDVKTGQILALVGSKNFFDETIDGQVNVVTRLRQPGSSFKPIVYAAAFEKGYTPETVLFDVETNFGPAGPEKEEYIPRNYDEKFRGPVTMRQALAGSLNIPGVKTLYLSGLDRVLNLAQRMGYTSLTDKSRYGLSLVLGGGEIKLLEHTAAFGIFAREGKKIPTICILKIEDSKGKILEQNNPELILSQEVITPQITRLINDVLSDNQSRAFMFGQENPLTLPDRPVAAKTGTTNNFRDAWLIGYTPDLVTGVWVGNSRNEAMAEKASGANVAGPIWHEFMSKALAKTPGKNFNPPEPIEVVKPILRGEMPGEITLEVDKASGKLATDLTPDSQKIEKTFKKYYPILYYVNKNDPQGPAPEDPATDPQYDFWYEGIKNWLQDLASKPEEERTETIFEIPPRQYDDLHIPINQPSLSILFPQNGSVINDQVLTIKLKASAPRGLNKIICAVDNIPLDVVLIKEQDFEQTKKDSSHECVLNFAGLNSGEHKIKVTAFDDIDNGKSQKIWIIITQMFEQKISWLIPKNDWTIQQRDFPLTLSILAPVVKIKMVRFFAQNLTTLQTSLIGTIFDPEASGRITLNWNMADKTEYKLWAEIIDTSNQTLIGEEIEIEVK